MATRAAIVTPWSRKPGENAPLFDSEYSYTTWQDITGQDVRQIVPNPNEFTILAEMPDDVFAVLEKDPDYEVLWSEKVEVANG